MPEIKNPHVFHQVAIDGYSVKPTKLGHVINIKLSLPYNAATLEALTRMQNRMLGWLVYAYKEEMGQMRDEVTGEIVYDAGVSEGTQLRLIADVEEAAAAADANAPDSGGE